MKTYFMRAAMGIFTLVMAWSPFIPLHAVDHEPPHESYAPRTYEDKLSAFSTHFLYGTVDFRLIDFDDNFFYFKENSLVPDL